MPAQSSDECPQCVAAGRPLLAAVVHGHTNSRGYTAVQYISTSVLRGAYSGSAVQAPGSEEEQAHDDKGAKHQQKS